MANNKIKKISYVFFLIGFAFLSFVYKSQADILDSWQDEDAYKPNPILFLHGFAQGSPESWNNVADSLNRYFDDYTQVSANLDLSRPYLERLAFNDPNGSIDTYDDGRDGWADKVNYRVSLLSDTYRFRETSLKVNLVAHSMGGLAAREYLTNSRYSHNVEIDKIITIGTPHAGTPLANVTVEKAIIGVNKYIWEVPYFGKTQVIFETDGLDPYMMLVRGTFKIDFNGEAIRDMAVGSPFLLSLNYNRSQPVDIKNFALYGGAYSLISEQLNFLFFSLYYPDEPFTCGDGLVPRDSQKGYDIMTYYPSAAFWVWNNISDISDVEADHLEELNSSDTPNKILSFLDSTTPEFEITYPEPGEITEILQSSIHIQGKVYKEYLPADSRLIINVERQDDGYRFSPPESYLKPSDLWIPNDPDSPVAEFDEIINFPGEGTYRISCQVKNPANEPSEIIDVRVRVLYEGTNIIVHCHNPEGKEINSIYYHYDNFLELENEGIFAWWKIDNGYWYKGAYEIEQHNRPYPVTPGVHTITATVHGITQTQTIEVGANETSVVTFTFDREILPYSQWIDLLAGSNSGSISVDTEFERQAFDDSSLFLPGVFIRPSTGTSKFQFTYWLRDGNGTFHLSAEGTSEEEFSSSVYRMNGTASISITPIGDANNLWGYCGIYTQFYNIKYIPYSLDGDPERRWIVQWILPLPEGCRVYDCSRPSYPDLYISNTPDPQDHYYARRILNGSKTEGLLVMPAEIPDGQYLVATGGWAMEAGDVNIDVNNGILENSGTVIDLTQNVTHLSAVSIPYDLSGDAF